MISLRGAATGEKPEHCGIEDDARDMRPPQSRADRVVRQGCAKAVSSSSSFRKAYGSPRTVAFFAYGVRLAVHRVTGEIVILYNIEAVDAGVVMNPHQLRGQVVGGVVMGIGYALAGEDGV